MLLLNPAGVVVLEQALLVLLLFGQGRGEAPPGGQSPRLAGAKGFDLRQGAGWFTGVVTVSEAGLRPASC